MKGFSETVNVNLPVIVDYVISGNDLTITRIECAGTGLGIKALPGSVQDKIYSDVAASIRCYERERETAFDWTTQTR
jgi:hypothetical protein